MDGVVTGSVQSELGTGVVINGRARSVRSGGTGRRMTPIYHITHISNLPSILQEGGLLCDAMQRTRRLFNMEIAHPNLKERRMRVPVPQGGVLADYVPLYFTERSPMLYSIHTGHVSNYTAGQEEIIYLVSSIERVQAGDCIWCFTDGHAVEAMTSFYSDPEKLSKLDWGVINAWRWKNTDDDNDRKRRKQAEFLVLEKFPWELVESIGVINSAMAENVRSLMRRHSHQPPVHVRRRWYY